MLDNFTEKEGLKVLGIIDEDSERKLQKNFLKNYEVTLKQLFRKGKINKFPELYKYFFKNTKVPKIHSESRYHIKSGFFGDNHIRKFSDINFDWSSHCKLEERYKQTNNLDFEFILEHLPLNIRETIFCFYEMCNSLANKHSKNADGTDHTKSILEFYCSYLYFSKHMDSLRFLVVYDGGSFEYYLEGRLVIPCYYVSDHDALYSDIFKDVCTTELEITFEYLESDFKLNNIPNITSLEYLREMADYLNLVILPIEYSKCHLNSKYKKIINEFSSYNVFVITTLENYDPWKEIIDDNDKPKSKFFPTDLSQLAISMHFSIISQKTIYQMLTSLEKRVDELENAFNQNMHIIQNQIHQLQFNAVKTELQISALAIHLMRIEMEKISLNKKAFVALEKQRTSIDCSPTAVNRELIINHLSHEQDKLIDLNFTSKEIIQDIDRIINLGLISFENFQLEFIKKTTKIQEFKQNIHDSKCIFVLTKASDLYKDDFAFIF